MRNPAMPVSISSDRLTATLRIDPIAYPLGVEPAELRSYLSGLGIRFHESDISAVMCDTGKIPPGVALVVARGQPPIHASAGTLKLTSESAQKAQNHYDRSDIHTAKSGQIIARIEGATKGQDGVDVHGKPIAHRSAVAPVVRLGKHVQMDPTGAHVLAERSGRVIVEDRLIRIEPVLRIAGNVDFSTGNINFDGDIEISGNVVDLFKVHGKSILVEGAVESAEVCAAENLNVHGGIVGKDKGQCSAGGNIDAKFITNTHVKTGGNLNVANEIAASHIACRGRVTVATGAIVSGRIIANGGITCRELGSPGEVLTTVEAGIDGELLAVDPQFIARIEAERRKVVQRRATIEPLLRMQKSLTAQQKEQATEALYECDQADAELDKQFAPVRAMYEKARAGRNPEIIVESTLHPGVTIRILGLSATIDRAWNGPMRISARMINNEKRIVIQDIRNGQVHPIPTREVPDPQWKKLAELLGVNADAHALAS